MLDDQLIAIKSIGRYFGTNEQSPFDQFRHESAVEHAPNQRRMVRGHAAKQSTPPPKHPTNIDQGQG